MIKINLPEPKSAYVETLGDWQAFCHNIGLTYLPGGSERSSLNPGEWMVQSYSRPGGFFGGRRICFHESDRTKAIIFKLAWR